MERTEDVRRWVSERAAGIMRLVIAGESLREDTEGAVADGDFDYAAYVARELVLRALSVASLRGGGELDFDVSQAAFDWFEGVPNELVDRGRALALEVVDGPPDDPARWLAGLTGFVAGIEAMLGLDRPIPHLRTPDGMYASLALTRDWIDLCAELGGPVAAVGAGG
jgi:hypothetical protein